MYDSLGDRIAAVAPLAAFRHENEWHSAWFSARPLVAGPGGDGVLEPGAELSGKLEVQRPLGYTSAED